MSPKKIILTFLFTGVSFLLNAQNSDTLNSDSVSYRYGLIGIGPISQKITFLSPVKYSGLTFNREIGSYKLKNKKITSSFLYSNIGYSSNHTSGTNENEPLALSLLSADPIILINYGYLFNRRYRVNENKLPKNFPLFSIGWSYWMDYGSDIKYKNVNNILYYNFSNMAGISVGLQKRIKTKKMQLDISNEFTSPLFGIYSASEFGLPVPYTVLSEDAKIWKHLDVGSFETNFQFKNNLNFDFKIRSKKNDDVNTLRLQYGVNYTNLRLNNNQKVQVIHSFKFSYLFNISSYGHK